MLSIQKIKRNSLKTGSSTEVFGGAESIKFSEDRFTGVINTTENLEKIRTCLKENGYDPNKAFTHESFMKDVKINIQKKIMKCMQEQHKE